jgi:hypothetical protein
MRLDSERAKIKEKAMALEMTTGGYYTPEQKKFREQAYGIFNKILSEKGNTAKVQLSLFNNLIRWGADGNECFDKAGIANRSVVGDMKVKLESNIRQYGDKAYGLSAKQLAYAIDDTTKLVGNGN